VNLTLMPYTFQVTGTTSPFSLMRKDIATYGEENKLWTGEDAKGFSRVFSVSQVLSLKNRGGFE
jgi:argininosuccinate synthase